jgi:uncharacterized protein with HEPN domain
MSDDRLYLFHVREAINDIAEYTSGGKDFFFSDKKTKDAVIRNLEIIGEAVKNLSEDLKDNHPDVPWKQISGMRDKMIHKYFSVNLELVWEVVEQHLPPLKSKVDKLLDDFSKGIG